MQNRQFLPLWTRSHILSIFVHFEFLRGCLVKLAHFVYFMQIWHFACFDVRNVGYELWIVLLGFQKDECFQPLSILERVPIFSHRFKIGFAQESLQRLEKKRMATIFFYLTIFQCQTQSSSIFLEFSHLWYQYITVHP